MAYDRREATSAITIDFGGDTISLGSDYTVPDTVKAVVVVAAGNVVCRAVDGTADITITSAPVGFVLPWHCSVIRSSGTTATLASVKGR